MWNIEKWSIKNAKQIRVQNAESQPKRTRYADLRILTCKDVDLSKSNPKMTLKLGDDLGLIASSGQIFGQAKKFETEQIAYRLGRG